MVEEEWRLQDQSAREAPGTAPPGEESMEHLMESYMDEIDHELHGPRRGEVLEGTIVRVDPEGVLVDIGLKSEGLIPSHEVQKIRAAGEQLRVGDRVVVYVLQPESPDRHVILSLSRARMERGWRLAQQAQESNAPIEAEVVDYNRGGVIVNVYGLRGFVPLSQIARVRGSTTNAAEVEAQLRRLLHQTLPLKIIELNRRRNRLILSERQAVQEQRAHRKEQLIQELREGEVRRGRVTSLTDFGAFVDVGGADGLVHISELAWGTVGHPSEVVQVGQEVDVYVLGVDHERKKIALSLKRAQPEPWTRVEERYAVNQVVTATITKLAAFGAFARLEPGVEGLIHISEMSESHVTHPRQVVREGQRVAVRILRIEPDRRRIGLSMRDVLQPEDVEGPAEPGGAEGSASAAHAGKRRQEEVERESVEGLA
jgi:small subunit ribosomal protein S1